MKINFFRNGFASNSSSSHSLIFCEGLNEESEGFEFGWNFFTCCVDAVKQVISPSSTSSLQIPIKNDTNLIDVFATF
jgi:hypothetical protein